MKKINYKSDFDFILHLYDGCGNEVDFPDYDFTATFYTFSKANAFIASKRGEELVNCYNDKGRLHIVCDSHGLAAGELKVDFSVELPDGIYGDGYRRVVTPRELGIMLVCGEGDCPKGKDVEVVVPYVYLSAYELAKQAGYKGTLEEYTEALNNMPKMVEEAKNVVGRESEVIKSVENLKSEITGAIKDSNNAAGKALEAAGTAIEAVGKIDTTFEKLEAEIMSELDKSAYKTFDDMWKAAFGIWGDVDHSHMEGDKPAPYYGNELWMTYDEALEVVACGSMDTNQIGYRYADSKARTNVPTHNEPRQFSHGASISGDLPFVGSNLEVINLCSSFSNVMIGGGVKFENSRPLQSLQKCRKIIGKFGFGGNYTAIGCPLLEDFEWNYLALDSNIAGIPKASQHSIRFMLVNAANKNHITLTLHNDIYSKIINGEDEWGELLELAASKNISLASA